MKRNQEIKWRSTGLIPGVMQEALKNNQLKRPHPGVPVYPDEAPGFFYQREVNHEKGN